MQALLGGAAARGPGAGAGHKTSAPLGGALAVGRRAAGRQSSKQDGEQRERSSPARAPLSGELAVDRRAGGHAAQAGAAVQVSSKLGHVLRLLGEVHLVQHAGPDVAHDGCRRWAGKGGACNGCERGGEAAPPWWVKGPLSPSMEERMPPTMAAGRGGSAAQRDTRGRPGAASASPRLSGASPNIRRRAAGSRQRARRGSSRSRQARAHPRARCGPGRAAPTPGSGPTGRGS